MDYGGRVPVEQETDTRGILGNEGKDNEDNFGTEVVATVTDEHLEDSDLRLGSNYHPRRLVWSAPCLVRIKFVRDCTALVLAPLTALCDIFHLKYNKHC